MNKIKQICNRFKYSIGEVTTYQEDITALNKRIVKGTSFIGSIMMLVLTITAMFVKTVQKVLPLYLATFLLFLLIYLVVKFTKKEMKGIILFCNYTFLSAAFIFAIGLDMIQKNPTATTVCVLLVALPLLIVDQPIREGVYFLGITGLFVLEVVFVKQNAKASIDILNAFSFYVVGQFLGYNHNHMILENIKGRTQLAFQRDRDSLTALYNKGAIEAQASAFLLMDHAVATLFVIDMDNFKHVNDTYGHHAGDTLLIEIGNVLKSSFRSTDVISRFGGDEFTIFMPMTNDQEIIKKKAEQVLESVKNVRIEEDPDYRAHICMGIATCPDCGNEYETLFKKADAALYKVKKNGKNGYRIYDPDSKKTILLVDDVEVNRVVLREILKDEFHIIEAENGKEALAILEEVADVELVITDIQMPHMDGIELIRHIRENERFNDISIIANTQYGDNDQEAEAYRLGVSDFVYKPASPVAIQLCVRNIMKANHSL